MNGIEDILREELTDEQRAAATDSSPDILAIACAGSGKSRTLAYRIVWLIAQGVDPGSIVAFTFTEKAADSIQLRVATALSRIGMDPTILGRIYIGTIHGFCKKLLGQIDARYRQFDVLDENRLQLFLMSRYPRLGLHDLRRTRNARYFQTVKEVARAWSTAHDELLSLEDIEQHDPDLGGVLQALHREMDRDNFIDFSSMIRLVVDGLATGDDQALSATAHIDHLVVDEYQDTNPLQERLVELLRERCTSLVVAGDDDQSIYGWRGADIENILGFSNRYPDCSEHTLAHNFRSTPLIVRSADAFVAAELGPSRLAKEPTADDGDGSHDFRVLWFEDRPSEAEWVAEQLEGLLGSAYSDGLQPRGLTPADFAIVMRSTGSSEQDGTARHAAFTDALEARGIPYTLEAGGTVFDRPHVAALRESMELLRAGSPDRATLLAHLGEVVEPAYPHVDANRVIEIYARWGRLIHTPVAVERRRVYPQQLLHELLGAFGVAALDLDDGAMADIGLFSRMLQDVEAVYVSIDESRRFGDILNFLQNVAQRGYQTTTDAVIRRPDAVTVSTVHKVKGLEFPVVFLVDVEGQRFPVRRSTYDGWLPAAVIGTAAARGAYGNDRGQEARLFYTALTRAERFLYVTGAQQLPGGRRQRRPSPFAARLDDPAIDREPGLPDGLQPSTPRRRIDENILPTTFSEIRYYLRCPRDYRYRHVWGFSPPITEMFGFGQSVHASVGKVHERFPERAPTEEEAEEVTRDVFHLKHVPQSRDPETRPGAYESAREAAVDIVKRYVSDYSDDFQHRRQLELTFQIPLEKAVVEGAIDLLLRFDEEGNVLEACVVDFKTMEGGPEPVANQDLDWTELALQVQLYAKAATEVLDENAKTGAVHLLKDGQRIPIPVDAEAINAAIENVEWAVARVIGGEFPMRPHVDKCSSCDWVMICPQRPQPFDDDGAQPLHLPDPAGPTMVRAFSMYEASTA